MSLKAWKTAVVAVMALLMAASVGWAQGQVSAGYDLFQTDPDTTDLLGIPFVGDTDARPTFDFVGPPESANERRAIGDTDTIVHRQANASVETYPGTADPIPIELVLLNLVSAVEFDIDRDGMGDGRIYVTLQKDRDPAGEPRQDFDPEEPAPEEPAPEEPAPEEPAPEEPPLVMPGPRSTGEMTITFASAQGGTFRSELLIFADLRLGSAFGPIVCGVAAGLPSCADMDAGLTLGTTEDAVWSRESLPDSIEIRGVNSSLAAPDSSDPVDTSLDFWAGMDAFESITICVKHGGHPDPMGAPMAHGTCFTPCTTTALDENSCRNGKDDDCNGTIDDCDEDLEGPVVTAPADVTLECTTPPVDVSPGATGFATGTDNCFPRTLAAGNITYEDSPPTPVCGETFDLDRVWEATDDCGNSAKTPDLQQIHVVDTTDPVITVCPDDVDYILWTDDSSPDSQGFAEGTDTCTVAPDISHGDVSDPGVCRSENITRTWTITDDCGLSTSCQQLIVVLGPSDSIDDLTRLLEDLNVPDTQQCGRFIENKIRIASGHVCGNRTGPALNQLNQILDKLDSQQCSDIDPADKAAFEAAVNAIIAAIESMGEEPLCPEGCVE